MKKAKVEIRNKEHLKKAIAFARTLGKESKSSLRHGIHIINCFKRNYGDDCTLHLDPDWVDHSFAWTIIKYIYKEGEKIPSSSLRCYNGGLILHGFQETFSVELTSNNKPHWSIHT